MSNTVEEIIQKRFDEFGLSLVVDRSIIPIDNSTLFICSGMQQLKEYFKKPDGTTYGSRQSCIRTNDLELSGDGTHLTYFEMIGNFSFGGQKYEESVEMWHLILNDMGIADQIEIHVHPMRPDLCRMWTKRGYRTVDDSGCVWSDGDISGECCEVFYKGLELGNLVNPAGHSTDVGFGWERLHQVFEKQDRIDQTSLFIDHHPIVKDHSRALEVLHRNDIPPGNKGRSYVCRRLIRRMLPFLRGDEVFSFNEWIEQEKSRREKSIEIGKRKWKKYSNKSPEWWWDTFGILPEELPLLH